MAARRPARTLFVAATLAAGTTGAVLAAVGPAAAASTWWVSPSGTGTACTQAAPCATVTTALTKVVAGDTINVLPGTYTDQPYVQKAVTINGTAAGVTFRGTSSTTNGWAMAVSVNGAVNLSRLTLTAGHYTSGGALPIVAGTVSATDVDITNSSATNGGGAYVLSGTLSMTRGSVTGNTATAAAANQGFGGGIYAAANANLSLNGTTVSGNTADGTTKSLGLGGGILALGPTTTLTNAAVRNNTATASPVTNGYGGGLYAGGAALTANGTTFTGNTAGVGGAIANVKPVSLQASTLDGNTAQAAGAVYAAANVTMTGGALTNNKATANYGGGIYAGAALSLVVDGTDVEGNTAPVAGGAIASTGAVTTTVRNNALLKANTSPSGAAIFNAGTLSVAGSRFVGNNASYQGGGIYNGSSTASDPQSATVTSTDFTGNTAAYGGGAISSTASATLSVTGGTMSGNSALGGGAVVSAGTATISGATLSNNTATQVGGGALFNSGRLQVTDTTLDANTATYVSGNSSGLGGAIYSGASDANVTTQLTVKRSTLSNNQAYAGSAITAWSSGSGDVNQTSISDSTIASNASTSASGAILTVKHPVTLARSTVTGNTSAGGSGSGSVFSIATPAAVGVTGSIISGNSGSACNVAVTDGGSNLVGTGTATCGLGAAKDPQLGPLAANGGPTRTELPGPASPALDRIAAGSTSSLSDAVTGAAIGLCGGTDQRGTARPQGAKCDIGAVEADQTVPVVSGPDHLDVTVGSGTGASTWTSTGSPQATLSASGLPAGLHLVDNGDGTATLQGTPTGPGGQVSATINATNEAGTGTETVTFVVHQAPTLSGPTSDTFTVGQAGGPDVFTQTGGYPAATLATGSKLPDGVTFTPGIAGDNGTGTIAGTAAAGTGGQYPITITASNGTGPDASWPFTLTVDEAPSLSGPAAATYTVGTHGSTDLTVGGFPAPTLSATGLPAGLQTTAHGIAGTPSVGSGGEYDATVTATNGVGQDATKAIHVTVDEAPGIAGPASVRMVTGTSATFAYAATGYPVATITATGQLPDGVTLTDNGNGTASLAGTPAASAVGTYTVTVRASNGIGQDATQSVTIQVVPPVSITTDHLGDATVGSAYDAMVVAGGGFLPYTFSVSAGSLPEGLTLGTDGHLTGTPTGDAGTSTFTVKVTDGNGNVAQRQLSIVVAKGGTTLVAKPIVTVGTILKVTTFTVVLTGGVPPHGIAGQTITFHAGSKIICTATTTADGTASCDVGLSGLLSTLLNTGVYAQYDGNAKWNGSVVGIPLLF